MTTFKQLQESNPIVFEKINKCVNDSVYEINSNNFFIGRREVIHLLSYVNDKQWGSIAILCIKYDLKIKEVVENAFFEQSFVTIEEDNSIAFYHYPTNIKGWFGQVYFFIDEEGRIHS